MPMHAKTISKGGYVGEPPRLTDDQRLTQLERMMHAVVRHLRGVETMSDEGLQRFEKDLDRTLNSRWPDE